MKALIVASYADSLVRFRGDLIRAMRAKGVEVHAAAPALREGSEVVRELQRMGVITHDIFLQRTGMNPFLDVRSFLSVARVIHVVRPHVCLSYTAKPVVYGNLAAALFGVPTRVILVTGLGFLFSDERGLRSRIAAAVGRMLYRVSCRFASLAIFQNKDDEREFARRRFIRDGLRTCVVNGSGVDVDLYRSDAAPDGPITFLFIGRFNRDKGVIEFLEAAAVVKASHPDARFALVGWHDTNPSVVAPEVIDGFSRKGIVENIGKLDDVRPALRACSVFVLPSYREGTPRTVLEAMSVGRPIITTDAPGCRETVAEGLNGFLVPPKNVEKLAEAMVRFLDDPGLVPKMGARSREIAEQKYDVRKVNEVMLREMGI